MNIDYNAIGDRIRQTRQDKGITQVRLSDFLEISPEYVSRVERASTKPSLSTLAKISEILEVDLTYLLEGTTINSASYKLEEFSEILKYMSPSKSRLFYEIGQSILKSDM
jgi:transcriptional regulator with XRE-family HTH domain